MRTRFLILALASFIGAALLEHLALAGPNELLLTTPESQLVTLDRTCLWEFRINRQTHSAMVIYKACDASTPPKFVEKGAIIVGVDDHGYRVDYPVRGAVVGTSITFSRLSSDLAAATLPVALKTFATRLVPGS